MTAPTATDRLEVRLLGAPRLRYADVSCPARWHPRALSLLVYLLLHRSHPLDREGLAFALWPDLNADHARARLRAQLHGLTSTLPQELDVPWIIADRRSLQWNSGAPTWLDVDEYQQTAAGGTAEIAAAVQLYGGDLAAGLDDEWIVPLRERFREMQATLLTRLIHACREGHKFERAAEYAQELLRHDPFREDALRALMELRYESGDRARALQDYRVFAERLEKELGVEPMAETRSTFARIAAAKGHPAAAEPVAVLHQRPPHNLSPPLTSFRSRDEELAALTSLVAERRLVTITGTGGVGKTRLATESGYRLLDAFRDGVWIVELSDITDPRLVAETTARTLGMEDRSEQPSFAALYLRRCLVIFDNCEHVLDAVGATVRRLLKECPEVSVIATSREPLRVRGERVVMLEPLLVPADLEGVGPIAALVRASPAAQLFLERATELSPKFRAPERPDDWRALATTVRRLNGIPLAIELAAARTNVLSIERIAQSLDDRFSLLTRGARTDLPRHQTMQACFDWSYELLAPDEQREFRSLSVFAGGFTLDAAAFVAGKTRESTLALLQSLVDKSLLNADVETAEPRYALLETARAYAQQKLLAEHEGDLERRRHAEYFAALAEDFNGAYSRSISAAKPPPGARMDAETLMSSINRELDNVRVAMDWTIAGGRQVKLGARIVGAMWRFFVARSLYAEGERWAVAALDALVPGETPAIESQLQLLHAMTAAFPYFMPVYRRVNHGRAVDAARRALVLSSRAGDEQLATVAGGILVMNLCVEEHVGEAAAVAKQTVASAEHSGDPLHVGIALYFQAFTVALRDPSAGVTMLQRAYDAYDRAGFTYGRAYTQLALAESAYERGDPASALQSTREAQEYYQGIGDWSTLALARAQAAKYLCASGEMRTARAAAGDALRIAEETGDAAVIALALRTIAGIAVATGRADGAAGLLTAADVLLARTGRQRVLFALREYQRIDAAVDAGLDPAARDRAAREASQWTLPRAIAEASAVVDAPDAATLLSPWFGER